MEIVLIRHAIAVERSEARTDAERPLTERGQRRFRKAVDGLATLGLRIDHVFHSPWRRASETAHLLVPVLSDESSCLTETQHLAEPPEGALLSFAREKLTEAFGPAVLKPNLATVATPVRVAFVGHEPWMSELLALLLFGDLEGAEAMPFKKGGAAWLRSSMRPGDSELVAFLPPRLLRTLGKAANSAA